VGRGKAEKSKMTKKAGKRHTVDIQRKIKKEEDG
jgi:hypothetical protein